MHLDQGEYRKGNEDLLSAALQKLQGIVEPVFFLEQKTAIHSWYNLPGGSKDNEAANNTNNTTQNEQSCIVNVVESQFADHNNQQPGQAFHRS